MEIGGKLEVIKSYGLQIAEIEPTVYKVLNTEQEINADKLKHDLMDAALLRSQRIRWNRENGVNTAIAKIYYIIFETSKIDKFSRIAREGHADSTIDVCDFHEEVDSIDTLYRREEL